MQEAEINFGTRNRGEPETAYYQWVPFMLVINAVIFLIPKQLWKWGEGGFMKAFVSDDTKTISVCQNLEPDEILSSKLR